MCRCHNVLRPKIQHRLSTQIHSLIEFDKINMRVAKLLSVPEEDKTRCNLLDIGPCCNDDIFMFLQNINHILARDDWSHVTY